MPAGIKAGSGGVSAARPIARWLPEFDLGRFDLTNLRSGALRDFELPRDLGHDIGSRDWWFGLATVLTLCSAALVSGSWVPPLPLPARAPFNAGQFAETRADAIAPLALGGHSGRATAPGAQVEALQEAPERPRIETTVRLGGGESLARVLRRGGVGADEAAQVAAMIGGSVNAARIKPGTPVDIVLGRRESRSVPRPLEGLGLRAAFDLRIEIARGADGALQLKRIPIAVDDTPLRISGVVGSSLSRAARSAGVPARVVADYIQNMSYVIDFQRQVGSKDRYDIVVEHRRAATGETETGGLIYAGLSQKGEDRIDLLRWTYGGKSQFFRGNGESAKKGLMRTPVDGAHLTSGFGMRFHPILNYSRLHQGVDFGAAPGSPVMAAAGGKVTFAGPHGGHGNYIQVTHRPGLMTAYAHLSGFAVHTGQQVGQGQVIGYVGSTGLSTGPHLHYEVWLNNAPVNPVAIKFLGGTQLGGAELTRFKATLERMRGLKLAGAMDDDDPPVATVRAQQVSAPAAVAAYVAPPATRAAGPDKQRATRKLAPPAQHNNKGHDGKAKSGKSAKVVAKPEPKAKTGTKGSKAKVDAKTKPEKSNLSKTSATKVRKSAKADKTALKDKHTKPATKKAKP